MPDLSEISQVAYPMQMDLPLDPTETSLASDRNFVTFYQHTDSIRPMQMKIAERRRAVVCRLLSVLEITLEMVGAGNHSSVNSPCRVA